MKRHNSTYRYFSVLVILLVSALVIIQCKNEPSSTINTPVKPSGHQGIDALSAQIQNDPQNADLLKQRARLYYDMEVYHEAISDLILATEYDSLNADTWLLLADAFLDNNQSRQAIETLESFLQIRPDDILTRLKIAEFQLIIERYKAAHLHLDWVLKLEPDNAEALFMKGLVYRAEGLNIPAADHLQRAVQSDPDLVDGYLLLGELFEQAKNPLALKYYQNALRIQPDHKEARLAIANYYWTSDDYSAALASLDELITLDPFYTKALYNRGLIFLELDSIDKAYLSMEMAVKSDPTFAMAHYYLGHAMERKGDLNRARTHYINAQNLSPTNKKITESLSRIDD